MGQEDPNEIRFRSKEGSSLRLQKSNLKIGFVLNLCLQNESFPTYWKRPPSLIVGSSLDNKKFLVIWLLQNCSPLRRLTKVGQGGWLTCQLLFLLVSRFKIFSTKTDFDLWKSSKMGRSITLRIGGGVSSQNSVDSSQKRIVLAATSGGSSPKLVWLFCFHNGSVKPVAKIIQVECPDHSSSEPMVFDELGLFPLKCSIITGTSTKWDKMSALLPDHGDIVIANPLVASLSGGAEPPLLVLDNIPPTRLNLHSTASLNTLSTALD